MDVSAFKSHIKVAELPLEKLAGNSQISESEKLAEVSRQFEAILVRQILASAHKAAFPSSMNPQSSTSEIYQDMVTNQLAERISHSGGLGLGNALSAQLERQLQKTPPAQEADD